MELTLLLPLLVIHHVAVAISFLMDLRIIGCPQILWRLIARCTDNDIIAIRLYMVMISLITARIIWILLVSPA